MNTSAKKVNFDDDSMWVHLADGRVIAIPLTWFPRLWHATPAERATVEITPRGLHWDTLDEDISVDGLLAGMGDQTREVHIAQ
ncbi:MAG: DUF2442 domain-containing protein [Burkholderiaceae bacterium]|nr:DUF2442 domain-containing protein [Burkholderiaceae bacterium]